MNKRFADKSGNRKAFRRELLQNSIMCRKGELDQLIPSRRKVFRRKTFRRVASVPEKNCALFRGIVRYSDALSILPIR